jgi:hypothetical protein
MVYYTVTVYNSYMFLSSLLTWWYSEGLRKRLILERSRLSMIYDFFSLEILLRTVFAPYKQISASSSGVSLGDRWRAFWDRALSRLIGATMRITVIVIGFLALIVGLSFGLTVMFVWIVAPFLPIVGLILTLIGLEA